MKHRRGIIITAIIVASIAIIIGFIPWALSPIAKNYIVSNAETLIGRKVEMSSMRINLLNGSLSLSDFKMYEKDGHTIFVSAKDFYVSLSYFQMILGNTGISKLKMKDPYVSIIQNGNVFNFDDLTKHRSSSKRNTSKKYVLKKIYMEGGHIVYVDKQLSNKIDLDNLAIAIPKLVFGGSETNADAGVRLRLAGATIESRLLTTRRNNDYKLNLKFKKLPLDIIEPYLKQMFQVGKLKGSSEGELVISGNTHHFSVFHLKGQLTTKDFNITNIEGDPIAEIGDIQMRISEMSLAKMIFAFDYVTMKDAELNYIVHDSTNNFSVFLGPDTSALPPFSLRIRDLKVSDAKASYADLSLKHAFSINLSDVNILSHNFDYHGMSSLSINGELPKGGKLQIAWHGNPSDLTDQQLMVDLRNLSLPLLSPYFMEYTGRKISDGNMNFTSQNIIHDHAINSSNILDAYDIEVGKRNKSDEVEFSGLPVRLALFALKDNGNKIQLNLPVTGYTNDPHFSFRKIIMKAILNTLGKVALSPIHFLTGSLDSNDSGDWSSIAFNALQTDFTAEQYAKLNHLAEAIAQKEDVKIVLQQFVNTDRAVRAYMREHRSATEKSALDAVNRFADARNEVIAQYLREACHLGKGNFKVMMAPEESLKSFEGNDKFVIDMQVDED